MMCKLRFALAASLFLLAAGPLARAGDIIRVEGKLWNPDPQVSARSSAGSELGTKLDLQADLDLDDSTWVPWVKISVGGSQRLVASAMMVRLENKENPEISFDFGGETFTTAMEVETKLSVDIYRVAWEADWLNFSIPVLGDSRLGTVVGADVFDGYVSLESDTGLKEKEEFTAPVPFVGLQGEVGLPLGFSVFGEVGGMYAKHGDIEGRYLEFEAGLKFRVKFLYATASWRELNIDLKDDTDSLDVRLSGPALGVGLAF